MPHTPLLLAAALAAFFPALARATEPPPGNVLVILADDLGVDQLACYGLGGNVPATPVLDGMAANGIRFDHVWSNVNCSPTRATIQSGRYSVRTGVGTLVKNNYALQLAEVTIPEMLDLFGTGYSHAAIGKWHLGNNSVGGALAPNLAGYDHFAGVERGLVDDPDVGYFEWTKVVNGSVFPETGYALTDKVDDALAYTTTAPEPWFCYLAFNAPHSPFHAPPQNLHTVDLSMAGDPRINPRPYYRAMVEAMDTEIGRLLAGMGERAARTTIIFLGDNGTPVEVTVAPSIPERGKGSLFEGGIKVPMIVVSPLVDEPGSSCDALVNTTDIWATVAELAGAPIGMLSTAGPGGGGTPSGSARTSPLGSPASLPFGLPEAHELDSISFAPCIADPGLPGARKLAYAELFSPNGPGSANTYDEHRRAIRSRRYKLWQRIKPTGTDQLMFDMQADPGETTNLIGPGITAQEIAAYKRLLAEMDALLPTR